MGSVIIPDGAIFTEYSQARLMQTRRRPVRRTSPYEQNLNLALKTMQVAEAALSSPIVTGVTNLIRSAGEGAAGEQVRADAQQRLGASQAPAPQPQPVQVQQGPLVAPPAPGTELGLQQRVPDSTIPLGQPPAQLVAPAGSPPPMTRAIDLTNQTQQAPAPPPVPVQPQQQAPQPLSVDELINEAERIVEAKGGPEQSLDEALAHLEAVNVPNLIGLAKFARTPEEQARLRGLLDKFSGYAPVTSVFDAAAGGAGERASTELNREFNRAANVEVQRGGTRFDKILKVLSETNVDVSKALKLRAEGNLKGLEAELKRLAAPGDMGLTRSKTFKNYVVKGSGGGSGGSGRKSRSQLAEKGITPETTFDGKDAARKMRADVNRTDIPTMATELGVMKLANKYLSDKEALAFLEGNLPDISMMEGFAKTFAAAERAKAEYTARKLGNDVKAINGLLSKLRKMKSMGKKRLAYIDVTGNLLTKKSTIADFLRVTEDADPEKNPSVWARRERLLELLDSGEASPEFLMDEVSLDAGPLPDYGPPVPTKGSR